jgi:hypothetical protein
MKESDAWAGYRKSMKVHMEKGDYRRPWEWSTVMATMFIGHSRSIMKELQEIRASGVLAACSWDVDEDCTNLIHQRYHLLQWEKANPDKKIDQLKTVFEVGAGYGAMCIIIDRLGFEGKYYIVDLPELEQIQRKHLNHRGVKCRRKWGEIRRPDLFIALTSISEIPIKHRQKFMQRIRPKSYLITYQPTWGDDNNREYFMTWAEWQRDNGGPSFVRYENHHIDYLVSTTEVE